MRGSPAGPGTEAALGKSLDSTQIYKGFREGVDTPLSRAAALLLDTRTPRTQPVHFLLCSGGIFDQQPCLIATSAISKSLQTIEAFTFFFHESAPLHASPNRPTRQSRNGLFESLPHTEPRKTPGFPLNILGFYLNYGYPLVSYSFTSLIMIPPLSLGETSFGSGLGEDMPLTVLTTLFFVGALLNNIATRIIGTKFPRRTTILHHYFPHQRPL